MINIQSGNTVSRNGVTYQTDNPSFEVDLRGYGSRVSMDGLQLKGVRDVKIHTIMEETIVTIEFMASEAVGYAEPEK